MSITKIAKRVVEIWHDEEDRRTRNQILFALGATVFIGAAILRVRHNRRKRKQAQPASL